MNHDFSKLTELEENRGIVVSAFMYLRILQVTYSKLRDYAVTMGMTQSHVIEYVNRLNTDVVVDATMYAYKAEKSTALLIDDISNECLRIITLQDVRHEN